MNICLVFDSYGGWGGAEALAYDLATHLRDRGEKVSIILNQEALKFYTDLENVEIFNIGPIYRHKREKTPRKYDFFHRFLSLYRSYSWDLFHYLHCRKIRKELIQFLSRNHVDVVSALITPAILLVSYLADDLKALKIPMTAILTGEHLVRGTDYVPPVVRPIWKWRGKRLGKALRKMDWVISVSSFMSTIWEEQGVPLKHKSTVIPCGISLAEIRGSLGSPSKLKGEFNLLFPGGARYVKGGDLVLKSLPRVKKEIPGVHVYVALDVPQDHLLRQIVRDSELEQNVTFVGHLPPAEFQRLLNSVDMLVMPSRQEAFGTVYVEAMALGKPIIAANTGGTPELIKDGRNGILVELDPDQIAEAIIYSYRNEDLRKTISQNNLQDAARLDWSHIIDQYIDVFREVSKGKIS